MTRRATFTTLLVLCSASAHVRAEAPPLGRLFASPAERAALDAQRTPPPAPPPAPAMTEPAPVPALDPVAVDGVVRRDGGNNGGKNGGNSTVWLNGVPHSGARVKARGQGQAVTLDLPDGRKVILKAGQRFDPDSNRVGESHD